MNRYITLIIIAIAATTGCKKVIDIDYTNIDKLYVIEAKLSSEEQSVVISQTADMDELLSEDYITSASVTVSSSEGENYIFTPSEEGVFRPSQEIEMLEGSYYTAEIEIDGELFTSKSYLHTEPVISEVRYMKYSMAEGFDQIFFSFAIQDTPNEENYYRYRIRFIGNEEQGDELKWSLVKEVVDGDEIWLMTHLYSSVRELEDGDEVTVEVQAIDKDIYTYFYSLGLSSSSLANPQSNIEGGALGYFNAYTSSSFTSIYDSANVE